MGYLLPAEYAAYGLTAETAEAWVVAASAMIDSYCRRPSLLASSYTERMRVGRSQMVRLSYGPLLSITAARARFGCTSRDTWARRDEVLPFEVQAMFCAPGEWTTLDVTSLDVDAPRGEVRLPCNLLGARYGEVEVTYSAGVATAPDAVKVACAQIVKNAQAAPGLNVKSSRVDTMQMEYFSDSLLDAQVKALLRPYVAERLG